MQSYSTSTNYYQTVSVAMSDRWSIYYRLQDLGVSCSCNLHQPLQIEITTPSAAIQVWHVVRQETISRGKLITWLENCWASQEVTYLN